jgi:hypothetical protein
MKEVKQWVILGLICVVIITCFVVFAVPAILSTDSYLGEITLNTEQEYLAFKQELFNSSADWRKMEVLSSTPPIIVHFEVVVSSDYDFPYGDKTANTPINLVFSSFLVVFLLCCIGFIPNWEWRK